MTAQKLRKAGIKVYFDDIRINTHSKLIIIDLKSVFMGSHNLSHTALSKSNKTSLLIEDETLADYFSEYV